MYQFPFPAKESRIGCLISILWQRNGDHTVVVLTVTITIHFMHVRSDGVETVIYENILSVCAVITTLTNGRTIVSNVKTKSLF